MIKFKDVFQKELEYISLKRSFLKEKEINGESIKDNLTALALSGGGVRSATIALGFMKILNECGILKKFDYLSTVSGGGYIGSYVSAKLSKKKDYSTLFSEGKEPDGEDDIEHFRAHGSYMTPGNGFIKFINRIRLAGAFMASLIMNLLCVVLFLCAVLYFFKNVSNLVELNIVVLSFSEIAFYILIFSGLVLAIHFFLHYLRHIRWWSSDKLNYIEGGILFIFLFALLFYAGNKFTLPLSTSNYFYDFLIIVGILGIAGYFANPNILTLHRFYKDRLSDAYLRLIKDKSEDGEDILLKDLNSINEKSHGNPAPYHLINTCVNFLGANDENFMGSKTCDYFLLSSLHCGCDITGYIKTSDSMYNKISLSTALATSGAAVNPNMGSETKRANSFFMTLLSLMSGYWISNPYPNTFSKLPITWWPYYFLLLLFSKTDSKRQKVNLSDGGHIENLAVYELLRRRCKFILVLDSSMDPDYTFSDLNNLIIRAKNQLKMNIVFREGFEPESCINVKPSCGFSKTHFTIADITEMTGKNYTGKPYKGILVYVKSSILEQLNCELMHELDEEHRSFIYKTHHRNFPHEPTSDQFFDKDQWNAYYFLGKYIAGDLLGINIREEGSTKEFNKKYNDITKNDLISFFYSLKIKK